MTDIFGNIWQNEDDDKEKDQPTGGVVVRQSEGARPDARVRAVSSEQGIFGDFWQETKPKQEEQPAEQVQVSEPTEPPRQRGEYRGNLFQKLGQSYYDVITDVPRQTVKGLNMIFSVPEKVTGGISDQLMKNDSYNQFMTDAARGIDLGEGRAAVAVLNTAALGIGDVKPIMNTEVGKEIIKKQGEYTSNIPLKTVARFRALGDETYEEMKTQMLKDRYDPDNGNVKKFLYDLQDSGVQSLLGILITTGTVAATRNPKAGYAVGGLYYAGLSGGEQLNERGEVYSSSNIAIDVVGDSLINNALMGVFKMPAAAVARIPATAGLEGTTEVVQSLLKFQNSYILADSDEERDAVLDDARNYWKSGAWWREFGVGAVVGGVAQGGAEVLNSTGAAGDTRTDVENSLAFPIDESIAAGDVDPATVYQNGTDGVLTPQFAEGRINDVAQKLAKLDPTLEQQYRDSVDVENETMESIVQKGTELIDSFAADNPQGSEEVLNTAGTEGTGTKPPEGEQDQLAAIPEVADLIARADRGDTLSNNEQIALTQARQSFNDYANTFEVNQFTIPNEVAPETGDIAQIQTVEVGDKVAVKYTADVGETGLTIDYDLNTLYDSPQDATDAAIGSISTWVESQLDSPNISRVTQKRLEDLAKKVRNTRQEPCSSHSSN